MRPLTGSAPLAWLAALGAIVAVSWLQLVGAEVPLPGLRSLSAPSVGGPVAAASLAMAIFLSLPRLHSRDRLLVCAGASLCLFAVLVVYLSPAFALVYAFIAGNIIRETKRAA